MSENGKVTAQKRLPIGNDVRKRPVNCECGASLVGADHSRVANLVRDIGQQLQVLRARVDRASVVRDDGNNGP
jgi:hypothetical protein